ncbi:peptidylprolyl isomerase [Flavobacterium agricola]|uniref:Peptidylprolyl isomerase n=1 Tax=Flavobacterium agricola TaxID=2870839 RepID=A0ABY6LYW2_9FLAO|nr:peptidylprolyl isomerase [Flavobacterium agricola]UYW01424.1 peptidylprolyl isomerase [Flavobacterium agricola]
MIKKLLVFSKALTIGFIGLYAMQAQAQKKRIDGVIGVVGDYVILDSDIDKTFLELSAQNIPTKDISRCELLGKLLEEKVFAHQAIQDSIIVTDAEISSIVDQQIAAMTDQIGSVQKIVDFYKKKDLDDLKAALSEIIKDGKLADEMRRKIIDEVEVNPEEVRQFFASIPKDSLPYFGAEIEIAQIVFKPIISQDAKNDVINRLKEIRQEVLDGSSFFTKAVLYTEDPGSKATGGYYKMNRKTPFVKEFKDVAFSLKEGEISQPFETEFGYHIIYLEKIKGQDLELRHILLSPKVSASAELEARERAEKVRNEIIAGDITFADAAKKYSDEKETKNSGGNLINPRTLETRFELVKLDPNLYSKVSGLEVNEVSFPYSETDMQGNKQFKIFTVVNKWDEHLADFSTDYMKIRDLALNRKQTQEINKWMQKTIEDTYIFVAPDYKTCAFENNWFKK